MLLPRSEAVGSARLLALQLTRQGADLDGDIVVAPFRWQVLNVDVAARLTQKGTLVVTILVDGDNFQDFLLDGTKKISVGFSGADQLPPGECLFLNPES